MQISLAIHVQILPVKHNINEALFEHMAVRSLDISAPLACNILFIFMNSFIEQIISVFSCNLRLRVSVGCYKLFTNLEYLYIIYIH